MEEEADAAQAAEITRLLGEMKSGDPAAAARLYPLVYQELRRLAGRYMSRERNDHTLQPTALVNEAYLRMVQQKEPDWQGRQHFFAFSAHLMRNILVDHARANRAAKRGGEQQQVTLEDAMFAARGSGVDLLDLDGALTKLAAFDERQSRIVELKFFGGLGNEEIAAMLGISERTVKRDWNVARAWLHGELEGHG